MTFLAGAMPMKMTRAQSTPGNDVCGRRRVPILPIYWKKASEVEIVLDGEKEFIHSYSTFDEITGQVNLRFEKDTCIDDFGITFYGQTNTWIDKIATASPTMGRTTGKHTFLKVQQPIDQSHLPEFNIAKAGETYSIPFKFVVPDRVLDYICTHRVDHPTLRDCHLQLPPSIGDPMLSGQGNTLMDDLTPNMAKINYAIRVGLLKASPTIRKPEVVHEEMGIRIVPAREEQPPISIDHLSRMGQGKYVLRKEKNVRKGILKIGKKQGRLSAESFQPASLKLHHPSSTSDEPITTMTTVQLRYDPAAVEEEPPSLNSISNKLKVHTFFGAAPWTYFPAPDGYDIWSTMHSQYPESLELSSRNLSNVEWTKHEPLADSTASVASTSAPQTQHNSGPGAYARRLSKSTSVSVPSSYSANTHGSRSSTTELTRRASAISIASTESSTSSTNESHSASSSTSEASSTVNQTTKTAPPPTTKSTTSPSESYNPALPYYTTSIVVPITLPPTYMRSLVSDQPSSSSNTQQPQRRASNPAVHSSTSHKPIVFLPTFYSCLISRIYSLEMTVSAQSAGSMTLKLPLQLSQPYTNQAPSPSSPPSTLTTPTTNHVTWSNPFSNPPSRHTQTNLNEDASPPFDQTEDYTATDEAIARALETHDAQYLHHSHNQPRSSQGILQTVPEYDHASYIQPPPQQQPYRQSSFPLQPTTTTTTNTTPQTTEDDLPPDYNSHTIFQRVAAARRESANPSTNPGTTSEETNESSRIRRLMSVTGSSSRRRGSTDVPAGPSTSASKGEGRRRFSLIFG